MTKIAFIGAGSLGFTRGLVRDILTFPLLKDATLSLMDIDPERLEFAHKAVQKIVDLGDTRPPSKRRWTASRHSKTPTPCSAPSSPAASTSGSTTS